MSPLFNVSWVHGRVPAARRHLELGFDSQHCRKLVEILPLAASYFLPLVGATTSSVSCYIEVKLLPLRRRDWTDTGLCSTDPLALLVLSIQQGQTPFTNVTKFKVKDNIK